MDDDDIKACSWYKDGKIEYTAWLLEKMGLHEALKNCSIPAISDSRSPDKIMEGLGDTKQQYTIWHDGGEWLISVKGKEEEQCKTLREWICGNE
jgi:hypothetical protein